jgi:hypothetical protein
MGKVSMVLKIKLAIEEAQDKIGIREDAHGQARNRTPLTEFLVIKSLCDGCSCEGMGQAIHVFMLTR